MSYNCFHYGCVHANILNYDSIWYFIAEGRVDLIQKSRLEQAVNCLWFKVLHELRCWCVRKVCGGLSDIMVQREWFGSGCFTSMTYVTRGW